MFEPIIFAKKEVGYGKRYDSFFIFFSKNNIGIQELQTIFPNLELVTLKQVHGNNLVDWTISHDNSGRFEADGHFAIRSDLALCIYTADCLPIMIHDKEKYIALHAGWRSLSQKIISKAIEQSKIEVKKAQAYIGPHIRKEHFEVGNNVADKILKNLNQNKNRERFTTSHANPEKTYLDLTLLAIEEMQRSGLSSSSIYDSQYCTFADLNFHSFRRDANRSGRQISFIAKLTEAAFSKNLYI